MQLDMVVVAAVREVRGQAASAAHQHGVRPGRAPAPLDVPLLQIAIAGEAHGLAAMMDDDEAAAVAAGQVQRVAVPGRFQSWRGYRRRPRRPE